jgi:hypothetical protein
MGSEKRKGEDIPRAVHSGSRGEYLSATRELCSKERKASQILNLIFEFSSISAGTTDTDAPTSRARRASPTWNPIVVFYVADGLIMIRSSDEKSKNCGMNDHKTPPMPKSVCRTYATGTDVGPLAPVDYPSLHRMEWGTRPLFFPCGMQEVSHCSLRNSDDIRQRFVQVLHKRIPCK